MDEVSSNTESSSGASRHTHAGNVGIEDAKCGSRSQRNKNNLLHVERTFRDGIASNGNHETLNKIFDHTTNKLLNIEVQ